jgi:hypothetical protein
MNRKLAVTRRRLLQGTAMLPALGGLTAAMPAAASRSIYEELGVRTLINGQGVVTFYSCTLMPPEVHRAMARASGEVCGSRSGDGLQRLGSLHCASHRRVHRRYGS